MAETSVRVLGRALPVELVNTRFYRGGELHEGLRTVADARDFARLNAGSLSVPPSRVDESVRRALVKMREPVRDVLAALVEQRPPRREALTTLNRAASRRRTRLELRWASGRAPVVERRPEPPLGPADLARADVAEATMLFAESGDADRLRACQAPGCIGFFLQQHARQEWCSPGCGNRARNARFHQLRRRRA
jgi:predicted RNA-binding Zn ribbon-like protein